MIFEAIATDMDGVLIDTYKLNENSYIEAFKAHSLPLDELIYSRFFGRSFYDWFPELFPDCDDSLLHKIHQKKIEIYNSSLHLTKLNENLVKFLRQSELRQVLVTAATRVTVEALLEFYRLNRFFEHVICAEDVERRKPNPDCYIRAAQMLQVDNEKVLVFEDTDTGATAAKEAGMPCLYIKNWFKFE